MVEAYLGDGGSNVAMDSYKLQVGILLDRIQEPLQLAVTDPELTAGQASAHICMHLHIYATSGPAHQYPGFRC